MKGCWPNRSSPLILDNEMVRARRQELHELVDQLPDEELDRLKQHMQDQLRALHDPVLRAMLNAPIDDEPETEAERRAVERAERDIAAGRVSSLEEVERRLGLRVAKAPKKRSKTK